MDSIALRKVAGDVWLARGRVGLMVVATVFSVTALGSVLGAYGIVAREMPRSFLGTNPASATLVLAQPIDDELLQRVRQQPGIADAQLRSLVSMRVEVGPDHWLPLSVFVVEDFQDMRIETIEPVGGAWPPPIGAIVIERTALPVLGAALGSTLTIQTPSGDVRAVTVGAIASDPALAPAWQEQRGYAYASREMLQSMGVDAGLDQLKITVADNRFDASSITQTSRGLAAWLTQNGVNVEEVRIPPPGEHPHQRLMEALVMVLLVFAVFLFGLSGIVVATLISGLLSRHVRQIGAMKAIGGETWHIASMYAGLVGVVGVISVLFALLLSTIGARMLASVFAALSNITLADVAVPWWTYGLMAIAAIVLTQLAALRPIMRASAITVREAISDTGAYSFGNVVSSPVMSRVMRLFGPTLALAARNALRRRSRLMLAAGLLAFGGALFMSGMNVAAAADARMAALEATRAYDIDLTLNRTAPVGDLVDLVGGVSGVTHVEPLDFVSVIPTEPGEIPISSTHKDGGHGSMPLWAAPPDTRYPNALVEGRALQADDTDALVAGRGTLQELGANIGDTVWLAIDGRPTRWQIVGIVQAFGLGAGTGVYTTDSAFAQATGQLGKTGGLRIETKEHDQAARLATLSAVSGALRGADLSIASDMEADWLNTALRNHIAIVQGALQFLGFLVGIVGAFTLASAISIGVIERSRDFGVMQTLGAGTIRIVEIVIAEGTLVAIVSWIGAVCLMTLISYLLDVFIGAFLFDAPLGLVFSPLAIAAWLLIALAASVLAGAIPASAAARMTIRETLAYT